MGSSLHLNQAHQTHPAHFLQSNVCKENVLTESTETDVWVEEEGSRETEWGTIRTFCFFFLTPLYWKCFQQVGQVEFIHISSHWILINLEFSSKTPNDRAQLPPTAPAPSHFLPNPHQSGGESKRAREVRKEWDLMRQWVVLWEPTVGWKLKK